MLHLKSKQNFTDDFVDPVRFTFSRRQESQRLQVTPASEEREKERGGGGREEDEKERERERER